MDSLAEARQIVRSLVAAGVRHAVYCPGSRNSPIAYALDAEPNIESFVRLDERSAGFFALGLAIEAGPVAIFVTSGTAVAELHPAVVEAYHSAAPLVVVTADRPFRLRGVGASQTTPQVGIFGPHVRACWDVAPQPDAGALNAGIQRHVAVARGLVNAGEGTGAGPVHINVQFDTPLVPAAPAQTEGAAAGSSGGPSGSPATGPAGADGATSATDDTPSIPAVRFLRATPRPIPWNEVVTPVPTVAIVGSGAAAGLPSGIRSLVEAGIPVLAEPTAPLRPLPFGRLTLAHPVAAQIRQAVVIGRPTLSREVVALLSRPDVRVVAVTGGEAVTDITSRASVVVDVLDAPPAPSGEQTSLRNAIDAAHATVASQVARFLGNDPAPLPIGALGSFLMQHASHTVMAGASNAIRLIDTLGWLPARRIVANRGAAGIDGTLATASGIAAARGEEVTVLLGDLTFLHDAMGLAWEPGRPRPTLRIVVVDNRGGGIFGTLEPAGQHVRSSFDRWFRTEQSASIDDMARAMSASYLRVTTAEQLDNAAQWWASQRAGVSVLHVVTASDVDALRRVVPAIAHG